jgi:beta-glucanase (GH16 family)
MPSLMNITASPLDAFGKKLDEIANNVCSTNPKASSYQDFMKVFVGFLMLAGLFVGAKAEAATGWNLTFSDEFNGTSLDSTKWITTYPGGGQTAGGNNELQWYVNNAFTFPAPGSGGYLRINTAKTNTVNSQCYTGTCIYTSGLIDSYGKFSQAYGYWEMRAQLPAGQGLWPAFWLLPYSSPMTWPQSYEIDAFEVGYGGGSTMNPLLQTAFHWGNMTQQAYNQISASGLSSGFHTYAVDWEPGSIAYYLDGSQIWQVTSNVPSNPAFVLANLAIGDYAWSMIGTPTSAVDSQIANNQVPMLIDYIRVYQKSSSGCYSAIPGPTPIPSTTCSGPSDTTPPAAPRRLSGR